MLTRREMIMSAALAGGAGLLSSSVSGAQEAKAAVAANTSSTLPKVPPPSRRTRGDLSYTPVHSLNGRSMPLVMKNGVKEFHLIAEEFEHEFAPGSYIKAWGYNGSTPGPTIEAVEGDRIRLLVTNKLPEHTTIHWHAIFLPNGTVGVAGLN